MRDYYKPDLDRNKKYLPEVSVVLPTYNESNIIKNRLKNLLRTTYPKCKIEVIIADDSTDDTVDCAESFFNSIKTDARLEIIETNERNGVAAALNNAIPAASGEIIFRTDADARLATDAISKAVSDLSDPSVSGVTGRQSEVIGGSIVESNYRNMLAGLQSLETRLDSVFIVHGPCFAFRRKEFQPLPVDTVADDTAIAVQLRRNGGRIIMNPTIKFAEGGTSSVLNRRTRKDRRAVGLLQQLIRHRTALGKYGSYGNVVLPLNWILMIVAPWLLVVVASITTMTSIALFGSLGLIIPTVIILFFVAGGNERLGPLQPMYAVADAWLSLLIASIRVLRGDINATWEVDNKVREGL